MGAPLLILAAFGAALALAGPGGTAARAPADRLDPDIALRVSAAGLAISLERRCPPPAILACRPAIRLTGRLRAEPPPRPVVQVEMNLGTLRALLESLSP